MSQVIVHGVPGSPYVRAALLALIEKRAPWRLAPLGPGEMKSPSHLGRHPFGRIPAIEHDGFGLYETQAILRYVDQVFDGPALTPEHPRSAARMNQVMGIVDWYFFPSAGMGVAFNRLVAPRFGMPVNEEAVSAALPMARVAVDALETLLGEQPYFAGDALCLADLHAGPQIDFFAQTEEGAQMLAGSRLSTWLDRLRARPSFQSTTWDALLEAASSGPLPPRAAGRGDRRKAAVGGAQGPGTIPTCRLAPLPPIRLRRNGPPSPLRGAGEGFQALGSAAAARARAVTRDQSAARTASSGATQLPPTQITLGWAR
jgi:glutathione S-transferase